MNLDVDRLTDWFKANKRDLPWRHTDDPYAIWISEIMLQQTRVDTVIPYYLRFLDALPTLSDLADIDEEKLLKLWEGLGYYSRARNLKTSAQIILQRFNGKFPDTYADILSLKGIGDYSAGAILSRAFHLPYASVDGNVLRVLTRLNEDDSDISSPTTKKFFKEQLEKCRPEDFGIFNESLMELGATICTPKNAECFRCPLQDQCASHLHGTVSHYPIKGRKVPNRELDYTCLFLYTKDNLFYFEKKEKGVLSGLPAPILLPGHISAIDAASSLSARGLSVVSLASLSERKHVFSHQTWKMRGYRILIENPNILLPNLYSVDQIRNQLSIPVCFQKFFDELHIL